jgi:hypothetical protein
LKDRVSAINKQKSNRQKSLTSLAKKGVVRIGIGVCGRPRGHRALGARAMQSCGKTRGKYGHQIAAHAIDNRLKHGNVLVDAHGKAHDKAARAAYEHGHDYGRPAVEESIFDKVILVCIVHEYGHEYEIGHDYDHVYPDGRFFIYLTEL